MTVEQIEAPSSGAQSTGLIGSNIARPKALVGNATATDADEKYGLNWHGKRRACGQ